MRIDGLCAEDQNLIEDDIKKVVEILIDKIENDNLDAEVLADTYYDRGCAYSTLEDADNAIADYNNAISINKYLWKAYYNRGNIYYSCCEYTSAINDYSKSIDINNYDYSSYYNRGLAYYNLKKYDNALNDYQKVLKLNPDHEYTKIAIENLENLI